MVVVEGSLKQLDPENWEEVGKAFVEPNPMKRFGKPEEVGQLVAFLLSGDAGFINAAVTVLDEVSPRQCLDRLDASYLSTREQEGCAFPLWPTGPHDPMRPRWSA